MRLAVGGLLFLWAAAPALAKAVSFHVVVEGDLVLEASEPFEVNLLLQGEGQNRILRLEGTTSAVIDLPTDTDWQVTAEADGYWTAPRSLRVTEASSDISMVLWPASRLVGRWRVAVGNELPDRFRIRFAPVLAAKQNTRFPQYEFFCPVMDDGAWSCTVPAGQLDLRLRAEGFVSHYRWGVQLKPGEMQEVGSLDLERGASVVGWVRSQHAWQPDRCRLTLRPYVGDIPTRAAQERILSQALQVAPNERGFFSFAGVAPGDYVLLAEHPGMAVATLAPVTVLDGAETEVQELALQLPARLTLTLEPPVDPFLEPWHLHLSKRSPVPGHLDTVAAGEGQEGSWRVIGLDPGEYELRVLDTRGSTWWSESLEIESGEFSLPIELPFMRVQGQVRLGGEVVIGAQLQITDTEGSVRFHNWTREDGNFYVFLPKEERWDVEVEAADPPLHAFVADQVVTRRPGQRAGEMNIELPATRIQGEVVDESGTPVAGAKVDFHPRQPGKQSVFASRPVSRRTDEAGIFEFHGLRPGEWLASASVRTSTKAAVSEIVEISIQEDMDAPWLRLQVRSLQTVQGQVISPEGLGIPGTRVFGMVPSLEWLAHSPGQVVTGLSGEFEMQLPERASRLVLMVLPPGLTARLMHVGLPLAGPVIVEVGREGGTLELELADPRDHLFLSTGEFQAGGAWPLALLRAWAETRGQRLRSTRLIRAIGMPPGDYTLCRSDLPLEVFWLGPPTDTENCVTGSLAPYGELRLQTPGALTLEQAPPSEDGMPQ